MNNKGKGNPYEHPSFQSQEDLWQVAIGLDLPTGATFTRDLNGNPAIRLSESVPYPRVDAFSQPSVAEELLLTESDPSNPGVFVIPENSTTLITILNEAAGSTDSFEVSPSESRTLALISDVFSELTGALQRLAETDEVLPRSLDYRQVLIMKDVMGCKLLPPLTFEHFSTKAEFRQKWRKLHADLYASLQEGARTPSQRGLTSSLRVPLRDVFLERLSHEN